jgi:hypothetical protein
VTEDEQHAADLARVAALRGKRAEDYTPEKVAQRQHERVKANIPLSLINTLWKHHNEPKYEMAALDRLPTRSRAYITTSDLCISPLKWEQLVTHCGGEDGAIRLINGLKPLLIQSAVLHAYGPDHPQAADPPKPH